MDEQTNPITDNASLSRPIRSLAWLSLFTEMAVLVSLPAALVLAVAEMIHHGPHVTEVRIWLAFIIAILPFHIICVDRLLRRPRRHAPPRSAASVVFAGLFVSIMLALTALIVILPAGETLAALLRGETIAPQQLIGYAGILVFYQIVLWMAWLATPQLDVPMGHQNLVWHPRRRTQDAAVAEPVDEPPNALDD